MIFTDPPSILLAWCTTDPFADEADPLSNNKDVGSQQNYIHIRIQQRNGRKTLTTLQGLPKGTYTYSHRLLVPQTYFLSTEYDAKKVLKALRKVLYSSPIAISHPSLSHPLFACDSSARTSLLTRVLPFFLASRDIPIYLGICL